MKKKSIIGFSLIGLIIIFSVIVWISYRPANNDSLNQSNSDKNNLDENNSDNKSNDLITPIISVELDNYNKTLTIVSIEEGTNLLWSDVTLINGSATFPAGTIDVGDMVTDCQEILDFKWIPTNEVFLHVEFRRE